MRCSRHVPLNSTCVLVHSAMTCVTQRQGVFAHCHSISRAHRPHKVVPGSARKRFAEILSQHRAQSCSVPRPPPRRVAVDALFVNALPARHENADLLCIEMFPHELMHSPIRGLRVAESRCDVPFSLAASDVPNEPRAPSVDSHSPIRCRTKRAPWQDGHREPACLQRRRLTSDYSRNSRWKPGARR